MDRSSGKISAYAACVRDRDMYPVQGATPGHVSGE